MVFLLGILFSFTSAFAQLTNLEGTIGSRYDAITGTQNRVQDRVTIGFTVDAKGMFELVGIASNGPAFNNPYETFATFNGKPNDAATLVFRNLYLRKAIGDFKVEAGALPGENTIGAAGVGSTGWIDGVKVQYKAALGDIKVVGGSLGDFKTPNMFKRDFDANFLEVEISRKMYEDLTADIAYEHWDGDDYARADAKYDLHVLTDKVFTLIGGVLYDFQKNATNADLGVQFDMLNTFMDKYKGRMNTKIYFSYLDAQLDNRNQMIGQYFTTGPRMSLQFDGKIDQAGNYTWFTRVSTGVGSSNLGKTRVDIGVNLKFGYKPKKKLPQEQ